MSEIIHIVAKDRKEFKEYVDKVRGPNKKYRFVSGSEDLRGFSSENLNLFYVGAYFENPKINEILDEIKLINGGK